MPQEHIAEVMGHEDLRSTKVYTHFKDSIIKKGVVSIFDQFERQESGKRLAKS